MAYITKNSTLAELREATDIPYGSGTVPNTLDNKISPVIETNQKLLAHTTEWLSVSRSSTGTTSVRTATTDRDFFITGAVMSLDTDAAAANLVVAIQATVKGTARNILIFSTLAAAAAHRRDISISLPRPLKIDKGTAISFVCTFSAGTVKGDAIVFGYSPADLSS